jgi:uncharacterized protein
MRMNPRFLFNIVCLLTVYSGLNYYLGWHLTEWMDAAKVVYNPWIFWPIFGIVVYGYIGGRIPLPALLKPIGRLIKVVGSYYIFLFEMGLIAFLLSDIGKTVVWLCGFNMKDYTRYSGDVILVLLFLLLLIGSRNAWSPIVRKYDLAIDKPIGSAGKEWTVAVASDLHLGNVVGRKHLTRLVERVNAMKPDLVLFPGDVIDDAIEPFLRNNMSNLLAKIQSKHGVYAILGNHEYYGGHVQQYIDEMKRIGIPVLRDETVEVANVLYVAGRKDKTSESAGADGRMPVAALLEGLDQRKPIILMDHQPTKFAQAAEAGADVMLSGHTHRGQFAPNHLFTRRIFELDWGYMRKAAMHVVVSSGFGSWGPPIRIGSRSEIIQLTLQFKG